jgi:ubiquilin
MANMLNDPNMQQMMNEALNNPAMVDMMIQQNPLLRNNPHARQILSSPEFRQMMTNPEAMRQANAMRRMMGGGGFGGGASAFPAPGATDTTPSGAASSNPSANSPPPYNPFAAGGFGGAGGAGAGNPFAALFGQPPAAAGQTPSQTPPAPASAGQGTPGANADANAANPFASLFGNAPGGANPFQIPGMPPVTPEMMQQAMQMMQGGGMGDLFGPGGFGAGAGAGGASSPPPPADTRPPEERYESQLRQLNDMGFFDFDRNVEALRRSGGSVQGAIEQLLR